MVDELFDKFEILVYKNDFEGFKKELENTDVNLQNKYGWTLLHISIRRDRKQMVELLLEKGADINRVDGVGWTPLMEAVMDDMTDLCGYLIEKGADTSISNLRGATAAMLVKKFSRTSMEKFF